MKAYTLSLLAISVVPILALPACGDGGSSSAGGGGSTSTGGGGTSTGGTGGTGGTTSGGTGGTSTGGMSTGGTGGITGGTGGGGGLPTGDYDCSPPEGAIPALKRTEIATGLSAPILVRAAPGDNERLFIVEQGGRIQLVKNGVVEAEPFLDISDRVLYGGERGLLGLAFHPNYQQNGRFFVFYTDDVDSPGDQVIAEYSRSANPDLATADGNGFGTAVQKLITVNDSESNHNGGMLEFSPKDGFLYIGLGDEGGGGDNHGQFGNGLNLGTMWGKILRIDVSTTPYSIPSGNMTAIPPNNPSQGPVVPEIWDFGLRNPWRFGFDPCGGDLYIGDVGQGQWEEIDVEPAGMGNRNYGWRAYEGTHEYDSNLAATGQDWVAPVDEYSHGMGNCSVTGGYVFRSAAVPGLRGTYFYGDYCSGRIWTFRWDGASIQDKTERTADLDNPGQLSSFGQDNFGNVYVVEISGTVSRIDAE